jgi:hypothetical protein
MLAKLDELNAAELKRQTLHASEIGNFSGDILKSIQKNADKYLRELTRRNEQLLLKFDDILCVDDAKKHGILYFQTLAYLIGTLIT